MQIRDLEYFLAVCRTGNLTKAANELFITQPALTLAINRLEREFGTPLLIRTTRHVMLTKVGEMLSVEGQKLIDQCNMIHHKATDLSENAKDRIRVGITGSYGRSFLPRICVAFQERYPNTELVFTVESSGELRNMLNRKDLDMAIISSEGENETLRCETLYHERLILTMRSDSPYNELGFTDPRYGMPFIRLADLGDAPFLGYSADRSYLHLLGTNVCHENGYIPNVVFRSRQSSILLTMVFAGIGVALIPWSTFYLNSQKGDVSVTAYNVYGSSAQRRYVFAYRDDAYTPRSVRLLLETCTSVHEQIEQETKDLQFFDSLSKNIMASDMEEEMKQNG